MECTTTSGQNSQRSAKFNHLPIFVVVVVVVIVVPALIPLGEIFVGDPVLIFVLILVPPAYCSRGFFVIAWPPVEAI